jgi:hypothetical protein
MGESIEYPFEKTLDGHHIWYRQITADRLLQLLEIDDG